MRVAAGQLEALAAVIREGSFDGAARLLHVTPSAVSQRIKQLEEQVGTILVVRTSPCVATPIGEAVYRHALQVELLERDLLAAVVPVARGADAGGAAAPPMRMAIAVNADSLATWLMPALAAFGARTRARVDVALDDEDHTARWLRAGRVLGAVTSQGRAVQGCRVQPLGVMRYVATASPRFVRRWLAPGITAAALQAAPSLAYNRKDRACGQFLAEQLGCPDADLQPHYLPSPHAYVDACLGDLGWGMNPESLVAGLIARRRLVDLLPGRTVDVALYWQQWALSSASVDALAHALHEHAAASLRPIG